MLNVSIYPKDLTHYPYINISSIHNKAILLSNGYILIYLILLDRSPKII